MLGAVEHMPTWLPTTSHLSRQEKSRRLFSTFDGLLERKV